MEGQKCKMIKELKHSVTRIQYLIYDRAQYRKLRKV